MKRMKKLQNLSFVLVALAVMLVFTVSSCQKDILDSGQTVKVEKAGFVEGSFIAEESDVVVFEKSTPIAVAREYTYLIGENEGGSALLPSQTPNNYSPYKLLRENLFIDGSLPFIFWQNPAHNPEMFSLSNVYSNLSPTVQSRMVCKVYNAQNQISHLGIVDFLPGTNSFPLKMKNKRVGAKILVNKDDIANLANTPLQSVTITPVMAAVDVMATIKTSAGTINPNGTLPVAGNSNANGWPEFVYTGAGSENPISVNIAQTGDITIYNEVELNIVPGTLVKVQVVIAGITINKTVDAPAVGYGLKIVIWTDKVGYYDSEWLNPEEEDLQVTVTQVKLEGPDHQ